MEKNYRPFLEEAIESKKRRQYASLERLWDDPSVPQKMLRAMDRARADSFSILDDVCSAAFVSRRAIETTMARMDAEIERRKGQHDTSDPDGFATGIYVDALQVLAEALNRGDAENT